MRKYLALFLTFMAINMNGQIDLSQRLINNKYIDTLNLDDIISDYGRPSFVKDNSVVKDILGPELSYHKKGLRFHFKPNNDLWFFTIHLSRTWDKSCLEWFAIYTDLLQDVNADKNLNDIKNMFPDGELKEPTEKNNVYFYKVNGFNFKFEGVTKYLESISYFPKDFK
ncbi:MAG TPA: hypothetical protein PKD51_11500 [Saprospiraceae bacterium]|nr:hypothetical protein [Saprospiraceae bacterium]